MTSRPATLSLNQLSSALDKAVGLAAQKHNLRHGEKNTIFINWELIGRRLLEADLKAASQFSETVSAGLKEARSTSNRSRSSCRKAASSRVCFPSNASANCSSSPDG